MSSRRNGPEKKIVKANAEEAGAGDRAFLQRHRSRGASERHQWGSRGNKVCTSAAKFGASSVGLALYNRQLWNVCASEPRRAGRGLTRPEILCAIRSKLLASKGSLVRDGLLRSFFSGGFECSSHRRHQDGRRLDLIAATAHDRWAEWDYRRLRQQGLACARAGIRWHLIEQAPGQYDFASVLPMLRAAQRAGVQVIWDLCHYGWPDDLDIFTPEFVRRYAGLARAFAEVHAGETDLVPFVAPINEISFFAWAAGEVGYMFPFARGRGQELKQQLVRAAIAGIEAVWSIDARARIVHVDPIIYVIPRHRRYRVSAENYRRAQYEAWDMLAGRAQPELGGAEKYLDIIGVNYYWNNQWFYPDGQKLLPAHLLYRPLRSLLCEVYERYQRPVFIAETGIEFTGRPAWLRYIGREVRQALKRGAKIEGICWYPIVNYPGWDNDRHCQNGLWDYADEMGDRPIYQPLADELRRQIRLFEQMHQPD